MTKEELHEEILGAYERYYFANIAINNEDEGGCSRWLEEVAPQLDEIL